MEENILVSPNELPLSDTEEVDVLVVENNELKRKPVTGLSGGKEDIDLLIVVSQDEGRNIDVTQDNSTIAEGNVEAVFAKIRAGLAPNVKIRYQSPDLNGYVSMVNEYKAVVYTYGENLFLKYLAMTYEGNDAHICYLVICPYEDFLESFTAKVI